jgi:hypothetical protein
MNERYLSYYDEYTWRAVVRFGWDALRTPSRLRRLSLRNRQHDYLGLSSHAELLALHRKLNEHHSGVSRQGLKVSRLVICGPPACPCTLGAHARAISVRKPDGS